MLLKWKCLSCFSFYGVFSFEMLMILSKIFQYFVVDISFMYWYTKYSVGSFKYNSHFYLKPFSSFSTSKLPHYGQGNNSYFLLLIVKLRKLRHTTSTTHNVNTCQFKVTIFPNITMNLFICYFLIFNIDPVFKVSSELSNIL